MKFLSCLAIFFSSVCVQDAPEDQVPASKFRKLRKVFVPQEDVEKFIKGRYLPIEIEKLDSFVKKRIQRTTQFELGNYELRWNPEEGLTGKANLQVPESDAEKRIDFESSLHFSNLQSLETEFHFGFMGRAQNEKQVFFASTGTKFQCDVSLPESASPKIYRIALPPSVKSDLTISVPLEYRLRSNQFFLPLSEIPTELPVVRKYKVGTVGDHILIEIVPSEKPDPSVSSRDLLSFGNRRAVWTTKFEIPSSAFNARQTLVTVASPFECLVARVNGMEILFEEVKRSKVDRVYRMEIPPKPSLFRNLSFEIEFVASVNGRKSLRFQPIKIAGFENASSRLEYQEPEDWKVDPVQVSGFQVSKSRGDSRIFFDRTAKNCQIVFVPGHRQKRSEVQRVEIDLRNGEIMTRQLFAGLSPKAVIKVNSDWDVRHAIDVFQDDLPVEFLQRKTSEGDIVVLDNENSSVWLLAAKKIDPAIEYVIEDFLLNKTVSSNPMVELKPGFVSGFGDGIRIPFGLPQEIKSGGLDFVRLSEINLSRFRLPADRQKFQADFEYAIEVDLGPAYARMDYHFFWNPQTHRTAIIELGLDASTVVKFPAGHVGSARILSGIEKQRLGLVAGRRYWALESHQRLAEQNSHFILSATSSFSEGSLKLELPRSIGDKDVFGKILLRGKNSNLVDCKSGNSIEIPVDSNEPQRSFELVGESLFEIQMPNGNSPASHGDFSVVKREMVVHGSGKWVQTIGLVGHDISQWKVSSTSPISHVSVKSSHQTSVAHRSSGGWIFGGSPGELIHEIELQILFDEPFRSPVYRVPDVRINERMVTMDCTTSVNEPLTVFRFDQLFSKRLNANLKTIFWFPSLAFDTYTTSELFPWNSKDLKPVLQPGKENHAILIKKNGVVVFALVVFALFTIWATRMKRNLTVLYLSLGSLLLSFLLSGVFALVMSFVFWGFSCGLLLRELSRLCRFPPVGSLPATAVVFLLLCNLENNCRAQELPKVQPQKESNPKTITAIIPVDSQEEPVGIAYLPEEFYERIARGSRVRQGLICRKMEFEVSAQSTETRFAASVRMEISKGQQGAMTLPFFVSNAVFDSDSVKIDDKTVSFIPDVANRKIDVQTEKSGEMSIEIDFLVPTGDRTEIEVLLPFSGLTTITNRARIGFNLVRPANQTPYVNLKPNFSGQFGVFDSFVMKAIPADATKVTLIEVVDFDRTPPLHSVQIIPEKTFTDDFVFGIRDDGKLVNETDYDELNQVFTADSSGTELLTVRFRSSENRLPGEIVVPSVLPLNHEIERYLVLVKSESEILLDNGKVLNNEKLRTETVDLWNQYATNELAVESIVVGTELDPRFSRVISSLSREPDLFCLAQHEIFISGREVQVDSEFEVSCEKGFETFQVVIPTYYTNIALRLGNRKLDWVRIDEQTIVVFANIVQAGGFVFEFRATFPIENDRFVIGEPSVKAAAFSSTNTIHSGRNRILLPKNVLPSKQGLRQERFVLVGSVNDLQEEIETRQQIPLQGLKVNEALTFEQGKVRHHLVFDMHSLAAGTWVGIEVPAGSVIPPTVSENEMIRVEKSSVFGQTQLWFPVIFDDGKFEIEILSSMEGNRVQLCRFVNVESVIRLTELPNFIGEDTLVWDLEEAPEISKTASATIFRTDRAESIARYQTIEIPDKRATVLFSESKYKNSERRLFSRFYVVPNENNEIRIQIPGNQIIESAKICGLSRHWRTEENGVIRLQLLNRRHLQVVDLSLLLKTGQQDLISVGMPIVVGAGRFQRFFQCGEGWIPAGVSENPANELDNCRTEFVTGAIELFELNHEGATGWSNVLMGYLKMNPNIGLDDREISMRIQQATGQDRQNSTVIQLTELCSMDLAIFEFTGNSVELVKKTVVLDPVPRLRLIGIVVTLGLIAFSTGRMPRGYQSIIYSFLLACVVWVLGVIWLSLTPDSIFAWCWILFALLFALLFVIDSLLQLRIYFPRTQKNPR